MSAKKRKVIVIPSRNLKYLMKDCGCGRTTVYVALRYATDNVHAEKIRRLALEKYEGVETTKVILL